MIKYNLNCKNCDNSFDSWFSSSKEFDRLKKKKHINCYSCSSFNVEKNIMSPSIFNFKNDGLKKNKSIKNENIKNQIKKYQKFIKSNFEYVGKNFPHEARLIQYEDKKKIKPIYGVASADEIKELKEEGIETKIIPWINESDN
jgi:hypothetical protein